MVLNYTKIPSYASKILLISIKDGINKNKFWTNINMAKKGTWEMLALHQMLESRLQVNRKIGNII